ncbi:MAG: AAA family ATPase, partial [Cyanobacteriota bacterium]
LIDRPLAELELPDPIAPLRLCPVGVNSHLLEEAARSRQLPVQVVAAPEQSDAVLTLRGALGRSPELRKRARGLGLPILVIKTDSVHQLQRAMERLLERRRPASAAATGLEDAHAAMEECRLAVEQVVLPQGRPVELLPRSEAVRQMQAELVGRYRLRTAVFGRGQQQRLRVFPA